MIAGIGTFLRACRSVALGALLLAIGAPAHAQSPRVDSFVREALQSGGDLPVIVRYKTADGLERGKKGSGSGKRDVGRHLKSLRALGLHVNGRALRELLEDPDVASISYDAPVRGHQLLSSVTSPVTPEHVTVDGSGAGLARSRYSVNGSGVTVAVVDSGVRPHNDLSSTRIKAFVDFVNGRTTPYDDYGHGTHVAGIIAGNGYSSSGKYKGVAPSASIVALKVLDQNGAGRTSDVLAALEWILANRVTYKIRVVNLSLGHAIYEPAATDPLVQLVDALSKKGIVVAVSAGNMGRNSLGQTVYGSITSPANAQGAITVGAVDTNNTLLRRDDTVAPFSSRGPTRFDRYVKPDMVAPGFHIASLLADNSTLAAKYPNLRIGTGYFRLNGTSQAAPVVSGAAALMLQANPGLSAHTVKAILQFTSQRLANLDVMTQGAGELNIPGAVRFAKLVYPSAQYGRRWVKGSRKAVQADLMFGDVVYWGKAVVWGGSIKSNANSLYVKLAQWDDNIVWGYLDDNIVWGYLDNIVWGMLSDDNIVWGLADENIVWGMTDDNIVWGFDDSVKSLADDNIVWGMFDNIVWGFSNGSVLAFTDEALIAMSAAEGGQ